MRKANSKETRRAVESYVLDEVQTILERGEVESPTRPITEAFGLIKDEMMYQVDFRDGHDIRGAGYVAQYMKAGRALDFTPANTPYWVWYLAVCVGEFEAYYANARERVAEWLDETQAEAARYTNDEVWNMYAHLSAKAFERLYERETRIRKVKTSEFIALYNERNGGSYFDRETLKYYGQTRGSFDVEGFYLVFDYRGVLHDCYCVSSVCNVDGKQFHMVDYFDRVTLERVYTRARAEAANIAEA